MEKSIRVEWKFFWRPGFMCKKCR